jgi:signal transduction histidine kinase
MTLRGGAGTFVAADGARVIRPHFAPLGSSEPAPIIVFLEDTGDLAAKVQQTKLAALGRLSASIAHEIRNPVGAMSHAAQLLAESPALSSADHRLTEIMQDNSRRVSDIIDNVLQLSRREAPRPGKLMLDAWTRRFRDEFCSTLQLQGQRLIIDPASEDVERAHRRQPAASDLLESVPEQCDARVAARRSGADRIALWPTVGSRPAVPAGRRPRPGHCPGRCGTDLRTVLHARRARHRARPVSGARARASQRCDPVV